LGRQPIKMDSLKYSIEKIECEEVFIIIRFIIEIKIKIK
jgi:hypothetical protein